MYRWRKRLGESRSFYVLHRYFRPPCAHEFGERERIHEQVPDAPDTEIGYLAERELKKRPRCNDMERLHVFVKVAQRGYRPWTLLYLVKEQERPARRYAAFRVRFYGGKYARHLEIAIENRADLLVGLEIDLYEIFEPLRKVADCRCLSYLPCAAKEQRLVGDIRRPLRQSNIYPSIYVHIEHLTFMK